MLPGGAGAGGGVGWSEGFLAGASRRDCGSGAARCCQVGHRARDIAWSGEGGSWVRV